MPFSLTRTFSSSFTPAAIIFSCNSKRFWALTSSSSFELLILSSSSAKARLPAGPAISLFVSFHLFSSFLFAMYDDELCAPLNRFFRSITSFCKAVLGCSAS